ncbi:uroporphyrinogen-III synthase [Janibacter sp. GXQ6167]|uniref:uroporphyrinogen-III synthase n=1 Tax=Janibacter sp. GXQ6167 TaxID=3240791 RepID=UPI0035253421
MLGQTLVGVTILVTADRRADDLRAALERRGARVLHTPAMTIIPTTEDARLLNQTRALIANPPDVLVVTTAIGLRGWVEAADAAGLEGALLDALEGVRVIVRGPKAHGAALAVGLTPDWVAESETTSEITSLLLDEGVQGRRVAVQFHGAGADGLDEAIAAAGADVVSVEVYRWGPAPDPEAVDLGLLQVAGGQVDVVVFTSAPAAEEWLRRAEALHVLPLLRDERPEVTYAAVGATTAAPLRRRGIEPILPDRSRLGALVRTVVHHVEEQREAAVATVGGVVHVRSAVGLLDDRVLALSPSSLAVLRLLTQRRGGVVSRDEVLAVLPGTSDDPHAAEVAVARLRDAIGDRRVVQTVVKRGYRLAVTGQQTHCDRRA